MTGIFKKMFGLQPPPPKEKPSLDSTLPDLKVIPAAQLARATSNGVWKVGYLQSVGRVRGHNEDSCFVFTSSLMEQGKNYPYGMFVVADGMGGHINGERASGITVRTLARETARIVSPGVYTGETLPSADQMKNMLNDAIQQANQAVKDEVPGGGTTVTALLILDQTMAIAHVGDSRAYHISPEGTLQPLTRDHSFVQSLVDLGQLTQAEASRHPQRNVLSMALGQLDPLTPELIQAPLPADGSLLICSDGLWGVIPGEVISQIVQDHPDPQQCCQKLIDAANMAGGPDNITAVYIKLPV